MRENHLRFLGALILLCVAGCFYVAAHRYSFSSVGNGQILKMDSLTGRVWVMTTDKQIELGKDGK
jgi:hypothetical protein